MSGQYLPITLAFRKTKANLSHAEAAPESISAALSGR